MGIFGKSRDAPRKEQRNQPSKQMQDFIRGIDVDFAGIIFINLDSVGSDFVSMCMKYSNISAPQFSS